jgi:DNA mismatch endonuclease (patch repair protein)
MSKPNARSVLEGYPVRRTHMDSSSPDIDPPPSPSRVRIMRGNKSRDTKPELALRRAIWAAGLRGYRVHRKGLPGSPDIAFGRARLAIFVDGCFWHGCPACYRAPKTRSEFWRIKVETNQRRDRRDEARLTELGWSVIRIWECELRADPAAFAAEVRSLVSATRASPTITHGFRA